MVYNACGMTRIAKETEGTIQASCFEYLAAKKHFFFRLNNIPVSDVNKKGERFFRKMSEWTPKGLPDAVVVAKGIFIGLEFKDKGKDLSPDQLAIHKKIILAGGECHVIRSIEDLQAIGL